MTCMVLGLKPMGKLVTSSKSLGGRYYYFLLEVTSFPIGLSLRTMQDLGSV